MNGHNRRQFLGTSAAASSVIALGGTVPAVLREAAADNNSDGRILVVVEMAGGNDGLNTVVPHRHSVYQQARPTLAVKGSDVLSITKDLGLHPSLSGFADLLEDGHLSIVQGVGYENPNRSHFESMDIWHTCQRKTDNRTDGWLGRYIEAATNNSTDPPAMHFGAEKQPFALTSRSMPVPSIRSLDEFRLNASGNQFKSAVRDLADARRGNDNDLLGFVQSSTSAAISASDRIESASAMKASRAGRRGNALGEKLTTVAQLIRSGLETSVYYVRMDGFDTHAQQGAAHAALLRRVSDAVSTFLKSMIAAGEADRIACVCFSEFGRRVKENASEGTDHGTAGPVFIAGTQVNAGLIGKHPNLNRLKKGDLQYHTDFRQVYAAVLQDWLKCDSNTILKGRFSPVKVFRS